MEPSEISLLILRHLARDGCVETIRTYLNECPAMKENLTVSAEGGLPDVEHFRQKLLNRSFNMSLIDLLNEYGRAKCMIQDLVTKLLFEWKALSTYFLSPYDSMATQLAHITNLLESKCKVTRTDSKCIGTNENEQMYAGIGFLLQAQKNPMVDVAVQTIDESEPATPPNPEEGSDLPTIVSSLLDPPMIDKIVEIANKEKLNRSNPTENVMTNDTESDIDKMLLDILNGISVGPLPTNALAPVCNNPESGPIETGSVDPQLIDLFQYAQSTIVHTPVPGTLSRLEDSASKQRPCGSFFDLIDTPLKSALLSIPNTPAEKLISDTHSSESEKMPEKSNLKTVELNFGPSTATSFRTGSTPFKLEANRGFLPKQKSGPKYTIINKQDHKQNSASQELQKIRKRRDITPRIPVPILDGIPQEINLILNADTSASSNGLVRSASKRKFSTPMKMSPVKAFLNSSVNFYCPSSALEKPGSANKAGNSQSASMETPVKHLPSPNFFMCPIDQQQQRSAHPVSILKSPLTTINYADLVPMSEADKNKDIKEMTPGVNKQMTKVDPPRNVPIDNNAGDILKKGQEIHKTPTNSVTEKSSHEDNNDKASPQPTYSRLLTSVRQTRPLSVILNKKSFSTPRKKGHIRNLLFKTPPSAQSERTENSSINFDDVSFKRKASPSSPLGSKSKKRLKWNSVVADTKIFDSLIEDDIQSESKEPEPCTSKSLVSMVDIASQIVSTPSVSTRSRSRNVKETPEVEKPKKSSRQTRGKISKKASPKPGDTLMSPPTPCRRSSKRLDDQRAADAAVITAVPLGGNVSATKIRLTRGSSKLVNEGSVSHPSEKGTTNVWVNLGDCTDKGTPSPNLSDPKNKSNLGVTELFGERLSFTSSTDSSAVSSSHNSDLLNYDATKKQELLKTPMSKSDFVSSNSPYIHNASSENQKKDKHDNAYLLRMRRSSKEVQPRTDEEVPCDLDLQPRPLSAAPTVSIATPKTQSTESSRLSYPCAKNMNDIAFPNLKAGLLNVQQTSPTDPNTSAGSASSTRETNATSPSRGRPKSPKKSPNKNPRRILPKPVPPDYPRAVFPPTPTSSYVLSIPCLSPASNSGGDLLKANAAFAPPRTLPSDTPTKPPKVTLSSSDSSSEFSHSIPMTPRLKNDSGDDTTSKLFWITRNDSLLGGAGNPIFSSTPMKGIPETPGKNLNIPTPAVIEGDSSTRTSLFDTPIKIDSPPKCAKPNVETTPEVRVEEKASIRPPIETTSRTTNKGAVRRSPRKPSSPYKVRAKTPRKPNTPVKSVQNLPGKASIDCKPARKPPNKATLDKISGTPKIYQAAPSAKTSITSKYNQPNSVLQSNKEPKEKAEARKFPTLCSKSKSFMRLSEIAKRGRQSSETNHRPATQMETNRVLNPASTGGLSVPNLNNDDACLEKPTKSSDVQFQFAVSGRTKQLSLSEHESLLGLLQIGTAKAQHKKHSRQSQKFDADLLSNIDLNKFLRTVHAGE